MKYVALLRGINVGGKNTIKMVELKQCFEAVGFSDVRTYINSGNIIFTSDEADDKALVQLIEKCISDNFKLEIPVVVRNQAEIDALANKIPSDWVNDQTMRTDVLFLWSEVDSPEVLKDIQTNSEVDNLLYHPGAVIWNFDRANYSKSKMHNFIGTKVYKLMTARNANTVRKLQLLMAD